MKNKVINTVSGASMEASLCRKIKNTYYKIGDVTVKDSGDCYYMEERGKYARLETGYIEYDFRLGRYVYKSSAELIKGIIALDKKGNLSYGYFSLDPSVEYTYLNTGSKNVPVLEDSILKNQNFYKEKLSDGIYYNRKSIDSLKFFLPQNCDQDYKRTLAYDSKGITGAVKKHYLANYKPSYSKTMDLYGDFMGNLSFGLEFETVKGVIPKTICNNLGLLPLRDGSVSGLEYVTVPLEGKKGVQTVLDVAKELKKRTIYDKNCSLHLHIGNIPRTEEFIIALYRVLFALQDDIFEMFPVYKKYNYGVKRKHYTKPLDYKNTIMLMDSKITSANIKKNFGVLYKYLSMGRSYEDLDNNLKNVKSHPSDPEGRSKWNIKTRYYWVNFVPLLFGNKQTVEFRIHTPTDDAHKIMYYMLLCSSIIKYAINNEKTILSNFSSISNMSLYDVLYDSLRKTSLKGDYSTLLDYTNSYFSKRKTHFYRAACRGVINETENNFRSFSRGIKWESSNDFKIKYDTINSDKNDSSQRITISPEPQRMWRASAPLRVGRPDGMRTVSRETERMINELRRREGQ